MGVIGSAKLLQALARDHLIPGLSLFGQGTKKADEPVYAVCITYLIAQITMFADINQIASFITMTVRHSLNLRVSIDHCLCLALQPAFQLLFRQQSWSNMRFPDKLTLL
jgi:potassium/chloride transporter 9